VLVVSTALAALGPGRVVELYARRMQIEESFRDLKDLRFGVGLDTSLTRKPARLAVLLLVRALASLIAWARGQAAIHTRGDRRRRWPDRSASGTGPSRAGGRQRDRRLQETRIWRCRAQRRLRRGSGQPHLAGDRGHERAVVRGGAWTAFFDCQRLKPDVGHLASRHNAASVHTGEKC
jgi:hypothetical protein